MTDLDEAFVDEVAETPLRIEHRGTDVLLRAPSPELDGGTSRAVAPSGDDEDDDAPGALDGGRIDAVLEVVVDDEVVGAIVPVGDGYGVLVVPEDGDDPSGEQDTLEAALDELGV